MHHLPKQPGIYELVLNHTQQRYTLAIPDGYTDEEPLPLILALHWGGSPHPYIGKSLLMGLVLPALSELGALFVAPDNQEAEWANPKSENDLIELLTFVGGNYNLNPQRTLITGYSLGGIGAWYLGARHQERFAGVLPISALPPNESIDFQWNIPIYAIHSQQDEFFPYIETERLVKRLQKDGFSVKLVTLDGITHFDTWNFIEPLHGAIPWIRRAWKIT